MSRASKLVLGLSVALTVGTVAGVHLKQAWDRQRLHDGVVRDLERWERKKENLRRLEEQRLLTRHLREERQRREEAQLHLPAGEEEQEQEVQRH